MRVNKEVVAALAKGLQDHIRDCMERGPEDEYVPGHSMYGQFSPLWQQELASQMVTQALFPDLRVFITISAEYRMVTPNLYGVSSHTLVTPVALVFAYWGASMPLRLSTSAYVANVIGLIPDDFGIATAERVLSLLDDDEAAMVDRLAYEDLISYYVSYIPLTMQERDDFIDFLNGDEDFAAFYQNVLTRGELFSRLELSQPQDSR